MARTGRRPGDTDTRAAILDAARRNFSANGFDRATIRGIAADAGVDPALVHHYFGTKNDLFSAALDIPVNPASVLPGIIAQGPDGLGERIVRTMIGVWDRTDVNPVMMVLRSLAADERLVAIVREFLVHNVVGPLGAQLGGPDAELRASLAASQLAGLVVARYVMRIEPLASADADTVARIVGPNVQRYLTGDLDT